MSYIDEVLGKVEQKNASQPEFLQAVREVLESLRPVIEAHEAEYRRDGVLELKDRRSGEAREVSVENAVAEVIAEVRGA